MESFELCCELPSPVPSIISAAISNRGRFVIFEEEI